MRFAKHENIVMMLIHAATFRSLISSVTYRSPTVLLVNGSPACLKLAIKFGVGRDTVRHAIHILMDEGLIWLVHGLGYYVRQQGH